LHKLGKRKDWLLLIQISLILALIALGFSNPQENLVGMAVLATIVGLFSAFQDTLIEAYRIEILPEKEVGIGASALVLGYRFGMLCAGAGALYLADYFGNWHIAYAIMAGFVSLGLLATLFSKPLVQNELKKTDKPKPMWPELKKWLYSKKIAWAILFILAFKLGDTVLHAMSMPFLIEIGFTKFEIAHIAKTYGIGAMILGVVVGGFWLKPKHLMRFLFVCASMQFVASLLFVWQVQMGHQTNCLLVTMGIENFTCGLSQVGLVAYLSSLCGGRFIATQYAFLSSYASCSRVGLTVLSGVLADRLNWANFYTVIALACLVSVALILIRTFRAQKGMVPEAA